MKRRILSIIIAGILVSTTGFSVFADNLTQSQKQQIAIGTQNLTKAEKELAEMDAQLIEVSSDIEIAQDEIKENQQKAEEIQRDIDSADGEINILKDKIKEKEETLGYSSNGIGKSDTASGYKNMILGSKNMSQFIKKVRDINSIKESDKEALEDLTTTREQLNRRIEKLNTDKEDIKVLSENNSKKIEENEQKKLELDKIAVEYEKRKNEADVNLGKNEKALYSHWRNVIENNKSVVGDLESAVTALQSIKGTLRSEEAKKDVDGLIEKANQQINSNKSGGTYTGQATGNANVVLSYAYKFLGYPYVWGAKGPNSFDCSGFVQYVFKNSVNISLPESTYTQVGCGQEVSRSELQPGDIIFMRKSERGPEHVGIYVGNNQIIHAADSKRGVIVGSISNYMTAKRVL